MTPAADVPPRSASSKAAPSRPATAGSRRQPPPPRKPGHVRRFVRPTLALVTLVLVADALVGENGWFERRHAQSRLEQMSGELEQVQQVNEALEIRRRRLEAGDRAIIESLAREKLEMLKPGEVLFIDGTPPVADQPAGTATSPAPTVSAR
jgi:cell division protein FtsB